MILSIVIPTYNEEENIGNVVSFIRENIKAAEAEVIISDGGSEDNTLEEARKAGAKAVLSPGKGRAAQMNYGVSIAKGDVLYFIHADCYPPSTFVNDIQWAITHGFDLGRYRTKFNSKKTLLKLNAWFTRFDLFICMGGDQTLFITRSLFKLCNGFREDMRIMEEYEFCERARKRGKYKILKGEVLISARKYETNSWVQVQLANFEVISMYKRGASQHDILNVYEQMLNYRKNSF
jgi:rSAM/selenodomain-associated transferase 2